MVAMLNVVVYCLVSLASCVAAFEDFGDRDGSFQFIYHDLHNLLLTLYDSTDALGRPVSACYFSEVDSGFKEVMLGQQKRLTESQVEAAIRTPNSDRVTMTSLDEMRDKYRDRLADFHCQGRQVYALRIDYFQCTFDAGLCTWRQSYGDSMDWILRSSATTTGFTGPDRDHTDPRVNGQYLYMEANYGGFGDTAELESPEFTLSTPICVRFWYHMLGNTMGSLHVLKVAGQTNSMIFNISDNQGNAWRQAEITVRPMSQAGELTRLLIRAVRGGGIYSDIAIDDVSSTPGVCTSARVDCDFEAAAGFCEWHIGNAGTMDWKLHRGPTETLNTGPSEDHTIGQGTTGQYVYVEGNEGRPQEQAILESPVLRLENPMCLEFWYFMEGSTVGQLAVYSRNSFTDAEQLLWSASGRQGNRWLQARVTVAPLPNATPLQLVLKAVRGSAIESDIAVDDIRGFLGTCQNN